MAKTDLTAQRLRELLHYDPETGIFTRRETGVLAGGLTSGYWRISVQCHSYWAHRLAWLYMTSSWPANDIDHIDGVRPNNKWANLRDVSTATNVQNTKRASRNNSCGLLGVESTKSGTFQARIMAMGKRQCLGTYATKEAAHEAYKQAKRRLHTGCTI